MALKDAVERVERLADASFDEIIVTLRELAELARAGADNATMEARLNAAADKLEAARGALDVVEEEVDPTPDTPPAEPTP